MATPSYHSFAVLIFYNVVYSGIADAKIVVFNEFNETIEKFSDVVISYGADLVKILQGMMAPACPFNACSPIQNAPSFPVFDSFVLIDGNASEDCPGYLKVLNAQRAGFDAAVIFGNTPAVEDVILPFDLVIPVIGVHSDVGFKIMKNYLLKKFDRHNFYWMKLIPDSYRIEVIVYGYAAAIFLVFVVIVGLYVWWHMYRERRRSRRNMLSNRQINRLESITFAQEDSYEKCTICMEEYEVGEKLRILPCGHAYHMSCIDPWLHDNADTCPLCKSKIGTSDLNSISSDVSQISFLQDNEEGHLIPSHQNQVFRASVSDSILVVRNVSNNLVQILSETNHQNAVVEDGDGHTNVLAKVHTSSENNSYQSPPVCGSINSCKESAEYVDALETVYGSVNSCKESGEYVDALETVYGSVNSCKESGEYVDALETVYGSVNSFEESAEYVDTLDRMSPPSAEHL